MTTHYIDFMVVSGPESTVSQLLGALYDRLHLALVEQRLESIGVSFPGYSTNPRTLGNVLRLHGEPAALNQLMDTNWLKGVRDHVRMTSIMPTPADALHRVVSRRQFKTSAERLRRRRMKRKGETAEQVAQAIPVTVERRPDLPYVHLRSLSNRQSFCLFIAVGPPQSRPIPGVFNSYGLGQVTTVPWF